MQKPWILVLVVGLIVILMTLLPLLAWIALFMRGKRFALRDRLQPADAIIVLAGTRGNSKIRSQQLLENSFVNKWISFGETPSQVLCKGREISPSKGIGMTKTGNTV
jgi:uncharacterized SAM-binding protein YcdF (DUF218 family)